MPEVTVPALAGLFLAFALFLPPLSLPMCVLLGIVSSWWVHQSSYASFMELPPYSIKNGTCPVDLLLGAPKEAERYKGRRKKGKGSQRQREKARDGLKRGKKQEDKMNRKTYAGRQGSCQLCPICPINTGKPTPHFRSWLNAAICCRPLVFPSGLSLWVASEVRLRCNTKHNSVNLSAV